jgi:hypothetical protein
MASIDSREIIDEMIANDGTYPGDPQATQLSQYINDWGGITYHIAMTPRDVQNLYDSPHCHDVKVLWKRKDKK